ncbi:hypothetical protein TWF481_010125 [Arthrobotrys musiformis]|uniref:Uncharacterized protein n=1 Tax=Arthrobotrys musiformis TaxID=47236 RepID=A0AAV9W1T0_9PEZI
MDSPTLQHMIRSSFQDMELVPVYEIPAGMASQDHKLMTTDEFHKSGGIVRLKTSAEAASDACFIYDPSMESRDFGDASPQIAQQPDHCSQACLLRFEKIEKALEAQRQTIEAQFRSQEVMQAQLEALAPFKELALRILLNLALNKANGSGFQFKDRKHFLTSAEFLTSRTKGFFKRQYKTRRMTILSRSSHTIEVGQIAQAIIYLPDDDVKKPPFAEIFKYVYDATPRALAKSKTLTTDLINAE